MNGRNLNQAKPKIENTPSRKMKKYSKLFSIILLCPSFTTTKTASLRRVMKERQNCLAPTKAKDITKLRETEKAHQELQAHIAQVQKLESIGILAGGIAHDFNNLLASILGNIEVAIVDIDRGDISPILNKEAVKEILSIDPDAKVLVSSGYFNDPIMANYKAYGFCGAMAKPYEMKELKKMIVQVLGPDG
jgi:hypothetical protein